MDRDKVDVSSEIVLTRKKSEVFRFFRGVFFSRASAHITGMQRTKREAKNKENKERGKAPVIWTVLQWLRSKWRERVGKRSGWIFLKDRSTASILKKNR